MKLQEQALPLPGEPWESRRQPLPAGVRSIGKIMPEILHQYGLSLDECRPQSLATAFVLIMPHSKSVLETVAAASS
jgi:hypothetical protein